MDLSEPGPRAALQWVGGHPARGELVKEAPNVPCLAGLPAAVVVIGQV
jgi:hypothetical protein